jgi:hypothetical protein
VSVFMIFSIARRSSDAEMCPENGGSPAFTLPWADDFFTSS